MAPSTCDHGVGAPKMDCLSARHLIAKQLINNKYLHSQTTPKKRKKGTMPKKMEKTRFNPAQPRHGPGLQKIFRGNWSAVRRNMESGSAWIAVSL